MLEIYMNEPFPTRHEAAQAKRLLEIMSKANQELDHAYLCFNFSFGGKSIDAAYITSDFFTIIEFKAVGGDVDCGASIENSEWTWQDSACSDKHTISTAPYGNPFVQVKNYRTATIRELENRQRSFLKNATLLKGTPRFAWWVRCCVLMSDRNAMPVEIRSNGISTNAAKWFSVGTIDAFCKNIGLMNKSVFVSSKEVEKLVRNVIGLRHVDEVVEDAGVKRYVEPLPQRQRAPIATMQTSTAIETFRKRYGDGAIRVPKVLKPSRQTDENKKGTETVNDFAEIDRLFNKSSVEVNSETARSGDNTDALVTASPRPFTIDDYLKSTLRDEMDFVAAGYGAISELSGESAIDIVRNSCPEIGKFEVLGILRFGNQLSREGADEVLTYFDNKYGASRRWYRLVSYDGGVNFIFGREVESPPPINVVRESRLYDKPISPDFLLARWLRNHVEREAEGLSPLSASEVQKTNKLSADDVRRYAKTYLPRSCAEAFVILDWSLGDKPVSGSVSILDVGCGSGGSGLGCVFALHKHSVGRYEITVEGLDVNTESLAFASNLFKATNTEFQNGRIQFNANLADISGEIKLSSEYDIVIASKSIGELALNGDRNAYLKAVGYCSCHVKPGGILVVIDIPKHEQSLNAATELLAKSGFEGWCKVMSVTLDGGKDKEDFVCSCMRRITETEKTKEHKNAE